MPYIADRYCIGKYFKESEIYDIIHPTLQMLKQMSDLDKGSNEILCFGFMVEAEKEID